MILPTHGQAKTAIRELLTFTDQLTDWEQGFVESNEDRLFFSEAQRAVIWKMAKKYELEHYSPVGKEE